MEKYSEQAGLEINNPAEQVASTKIEEENVNSSSSRKIRGWLLFFLIMITVKALNTFLTFMEEYIGAISYNSFYACTYLFIGIFILGWVGYTIYSFIKRKPNAVFLAKCFLVIYIYFNVLMLIFGDVKKDDLETIGTIIRDLIWNLLWIGFLCYSIVLEEIFPKHIRKAFVRDYCLIGFYMIALLVLFLIIV